MFLSNSLNSYCLFPIRWINRYWQIIYCEVHVTLRWTNIPLEVGEGGGGEGGRGGGGKGGKGGRG